MTKYILRDASGGCLSKTGGISPARKPLDFSIFETQEEADKMCSEMNGLYAWAGWKFTVEPISYKTELVFHGESYELTT